MSEDGRAFQYAIINVTGNSNTDLVAAQTGKRIRVYAYQLDGSNNYTFRSGTTSIAGAFALSAAEFCGMSFVGGLFETAAGEALNLLHTGNGTGFIVYSVL